MNFRATALVLGVLAASALLGGCASTTVQRAGCAIPQNSARGSSGALAMNDGASRVSMPSRSEGGMDISGDRSGIPTPEPAVPVREQQLAGPTPQVPIPHSGMFASPLY